MDLIKRAKQAIPARVKIRVSMVWYFTVDMRFINMDAIISRPVFRGGVDGSFFLKSLF